MYIVRLIYGLYSLSQKLYLLAKAFRREYQNYELSGLHAGKANYKGSNFAQGKTQNYTLTNNKKSSQGRNFVENFRNKNLITILHGKLLKLKMKGFD